MDIKTETKILLRESLDKDGRVDDNRVRAVCDYIESRGTPARIARMLKRYKAALEPIAERGVAIIESSGKMSEETLEGLRKFVETQTGRTVAIETQENPSLLGGVRIKCGDDIWECTAANALKEILK